MKRQKGNVKMFKAIALFVVLRRLPSCASFLVPSTVSLFLHSFFFAVLFLYFLPPLFYYLFIKYTLCFSARRSPFPALFFLSLCHYACLGIILCSKHNTVRSMRFAPIVYVSLAAPIDAMRAKAKKLSARVSCND